MHQFHAQRVRVFDGQCACRCCRCCIWHSFIHKTCHNTTTCILRHAQHTKNLSLHRALRAHTHTKSIILAKMPVGLFSFLILLVVVNKFGGVQIHWHMDETLWCCALTPALDRCSDSPNSQSALGHWYKVKSVFTPKYICVHVMYTRCEYLTVPRHCTAKCVSRTAVCSYVMRVPA
jgi:hypothetical protein